MVDHGSPILTAPVEGWWDAGKLETLLETNGLLYTSQEEFVDYAVQLLDGARRQQLSHPETERYHPGKEALALLEILQQAIDKSKRLE